MGPAGGQGGSSVPPEADRDAGRQGLDVVGPARGNVQHLPGCQQALLEPQASRLWELGVVRCVKVDLPQPTPCLPAG